MMTASRQRTAFTAKRRGAPWAACAACAWSVLFAVVSFYWAAGGTGGAHTIAAKPEKLASPAALWLIGVAKLLPVVLALALARPWRRPLPGRLLWAAAWVSGVLLLLYGGANLVDHALMVAGVIATPEILGATAARWHLFLWDPWWVLGGVLFIAAARRSARHRE